MRSSSVNIVTDNNTTENTEIRIAQAHMLKQRVVGSCIFVQAVIVYIAAMLWFGSSQMNAIIWIVPTTFMVIATYAYARIRAPSGINRDNVDSYLKGHIIMSSLTGALWGALAIYLLDWQSEYTVFVSCTIVATISLGGMLPGATYRPGFIGLSTFMIVPFGLYAALTGPGSLRLIGVGILIFYAFGLLTSARAQQNTRTGISAQRERELSAKITAQHKIIKHAHDEKTRFLAATSHDLSQPLHAQGYFIEALRKALRTSKQHTLLDKIEISWRAQRHLLQGLVDITRLESGVIVPKFSPLDIKEEMQNLATEFSEVAIAKSITLNLRFEGATIYTDAVLLARILRNILANAVKFTPEGGQIDFTAMQNGSTVKIVIKDTGLGVPLVDHERIFDEYVQLGNTHRDREKGIGLGLSIVQRLVTLLNIDMQFQSILGKGTQFTFTLPLHDAAHAPQVKKPQPTDTFTGSPLVVLVDDEKAIRESMSGLLTDWGCQLICAASGSEAIELLSETSEIPALLIVDKRLANKENGNNVIRALREEVNEITPAILITGDLNGFDGLKPVADIQLMVKPVEPREIKRAIADIIAR